MSEQPQTTPLTDPEQEWVRARRDFAAQEGVDHLELDDVEAYYDRLVARSAAEEVDPVELGVLLEVVVVLLGEHLGARHGMRWVTVAGESGPELGLQDTLSDAAIFPHAVVGERWNRGETGWMAGYVEWLGGQLQEHRAQTRARG